MALSQNEVDQSAASVTDSRQPPRHLNEFYSFVQSQQTSPIKGSNFSMSNWQSRRQNTSPLIDTFTSFLPSVLDLPTILSTKDFQQSLESYEKVVEKAKALSAALNEVTKASNEFGEALEDTVLLNGKMVHPKAVIGGIRNSAGLQYVIGSNQQILSRIIQEKFLEPLSEQINDLRENHQNHQMIYQKEIRVKSRALREQERENARLARLRVRNISKYKSQLLSLAGQVEEIDRLKYDYYHESISMLENFDQGQLLPFTGQLVRAQLELYEGIAKKGWSGGGLDGLLEISPDIFAMDNMDGEDDNQDITSQKQISPGDGDADATMITPNTSPRPDAEEVSKDEDNEENEDNEESFTLPIINQSLLRPNEDSRDEDDN